MANVVQQRTEAMAEALYARALELAGGHRQTAWRLLGVSRQALSKYLDKHPELAQRFPPAAAAPAVMPTFDPETFLAELQERRDPAKLPRRSPVDEEFNRFHQAHPEVLGELVKLARVALDRKQPRIPIKGMWEVLRWRMAGRRGFRHLKLNDHMTSRYARLLLAEVPELGGRMFTRKLRSAP